MGQAVIGAALSGLLLCGGHSIPVVRGPLLRPQHSLSALVRRGSDTDGYGFLGGNAWHRSARADVAVQTGKFVFPRLKFSVKDETKDIWNTGLRGDGLHRDPVAHGLRI